MYKLKEIADKVYYVGVNDRQKALFENMWPLPYGVSYSYLIVDEKTVLVDTVDVCYSDIFLKKIADALDGRPLDFLIVNHMEPDHAGSIRLLRQQYPDVQIVGNKQTFGMLNGYHGISTGLYEVKEGDTLSVGRHQLSFYMAPMVHWPEVMVTYDSTDKILFSADAFGTYGTLDGGVIDSEMNVEHYWEEMLRYYSNIVGKYGNPVQRALQKLSALDIRTICSTHGPVWCEYAAKAIDIYDRMSRYEGEEGVTIVYGSMYGNTEQMAEAIALIIGSPTYSNRLFPEIESILDKIETREVKHRLYGYFGSFTWAGAAVKNLAAFGEKMKWEVVGVPVEQKQALKADKYEECWALGEEMAKKLKTEN